MTLCELVQGDKNYFMVFHLEDAEGTPVDLSEGTIEVRLKLQKYGTDSILFSKLGEIIDGSKGKIRFKVEEELLEEKGDYVAEIEVSFLNISSILTWDGIHVHLTQDLPRRID